MQKPCRNFGRLFAMLENFLGIGLLTIILLDITLGIVFRQINVSVPWIEAVSKFSLAGLTFIGVSIGIRENSHVSFTSFIERLPQKFKPILALIHWLVWLACLALLTWLTWPLLVSYLARDMTDASLGINIFWLRLPFFAGLVFSLLRVIAQIYTSIKSIALGEAKEDQQACL